MKLIKIRVKGMLELNIEFNSTTIILGENGAGKTTLMNLILYALGAKINDFTGAINEGQCTQVELDIICKSNKKYKLIRSLPTSDFITVMSLDDESNLVDNEVDILDLTEFSDFILKEEGYDPQKISYGKNHSASLRFYFLLRAVFVDQNTPAHSILSNLGIPSFVASQKLIKKAIIEQLLGKENSDIQKLRLEVQSLTKKKSELTSSLRVINQFIKEQIEKDEDKQLVANDKRIKKNIEKILQEKEKLSKATLEDSFDLYAFNSEAKQKKLVEEQSKRSSANDQIRKIKLEIMDIDLATKQINEELNLLKKKMVARQFFTQIPVDFCPICLSDIKEHDINENCIFCNEKMPDLNEEETYQYRRLLKESIKESETIKDKLKSKLEEANKERDKIDQNIEKINKEYLQEKESSTTPLQHLVYSVKERLEHLIKSEEKHRNFLSHLEVKDSINEQITKNNSRIKQAKESLNALEKHSTEGDTDKTVTWERLFKHYLSTIFPTVNQANLDENYTPLVNELEPNKISSASLKVATRLSYILSLFTLNQYVDINHIGFVLFDSPRDKDLDFEKYTAFLELLNARESGQIILTGSLDELHLYQKVFREEDIIVEHNTILKEVQTTKQTPLKNT